MSLHHILLSFVYFCGIVLSAIYASRALPHANFIKAHGAELKHPPFDQLKLDGERDATEPPSAN